MLVNELAETMHIPIPKPDAPAKPTDLARKPSMQKPAQDSNGIPQYKAQLKKVEPKSRDQEPSKNEITASIIDFKSRLRRVDGHAVEENSSDASEKMKSDTKIISDDSMMTTNTNNKMKPNNNNNNTVNGGKETPLKKTEIRIEVVEAKNGSPDSKQSGSDDDDKRKSTGSISSLKKLWEAKEHQPIVGEQLSPKNNKKDDDSQNGNHEPSMDPPVAKKPAVPVKPSKFSIYATPIQQTGEIEKILLFFHES